MSGALKDRSHTLNISFTSERDSIREVSRRGREGPELFVNVRYFIHSISLPRRARTKQRDICMSAGYACDMRGRVEGIAIFGSALREN